MLLIVADFMPKSAIFDGLAPVSAPTSFREVRAEKLLPDGRLRL